MRNLLIVGESDFLRKSIHHLIASKINSHQKVYYIFSGEGGAEKAFSDISTKVFNKNKKIIPEDTAPQYMGEDLYMVPTNEEIGFALDEIIFSDIVSDMIVVINNIDTLAISILEKAKEILEDKNISIIGTIDKTVAQFTIFEGSNALFDKVSRIFTKEELLSLKKDKY